MHLCADLLEHFTNSGVAASGQPPRALWSQARTSRLQGLSLTLF